MSKGVPAVNTCEIGFASGLLGAGVGYILAPRKYNLEHLLTQDTVEFGKAIRTKYMKPGNKEQKDAYNLIVQARENLTQAFNSNAGEAKLVECTRDAKLIQAYKSIKKFIPHARGQSALFVGFLSALGAMALKVFSKNNA